MAKTWAEHRALGRCGWCGILPPVDQRSLCESCAERNRSRARAPRRQPLVAPPPLPPKPRKFIVVHGKEFEVMWDGT